MAHFSNEKRYSAVLLLYLLIRTCLNTNYGDIRRTAKRTDRAGRNEKNLVGYFVSVRFRDETRHATS